jgi:hypothetical protein
LTGHENLCDRQGQLTNSLTNEEEPALTELSQIEPRRGHGWAFLLRQRGIMFLNLTENKMIESDSESMFQRPKLTKEEIEANAAKHRFKKNFEPMTREEMQKSVDKAADLIINFSWEEEAIDEEEGTETLVVADEVVSECADKIVEYVAEHMNFDEFNTYETGIEISVPVPLSVHELLDLRFDNTFTLDSRIEQMDKVGTVLESIILHPESSAKLNAKLQTLLPPARASWEVVYICLDDDDIVLGGSKQDKSVNVALQIGKQHA